MFLHDSDIRPSLAAILKQDPAALPAYWDTILTDAHNKAYNEILRRLLARGFSIDQAKTWDAGAEFEKDMTLWWTLNNGGALNPAEDKWIMKLDRRKELDDVDVLIGGALVVPVTGRQGVGFG